jgi:hypothetical protein
VQVQDLHVHLDVWVEVAAQLAVQQLEPAVGQLVGEQAPGEADLPVEGLQGDPLRLGVQAVVQLVRDQVVGANAAAGLDAVAHRGSHERPPSGWVGRCRDRRGGVPVPGGRG